METAPNNPQPEQSPYTLEWKDLLEAITGDQPYNEVPRGVEASLVTSMGRMAAHTGQIECDTAIRSSMVESAPAGGATHCPRMRRRPHHAQDGTRPPASETSQMCARNSLRSSLRA